jgi:hypothetical protein
MLAWLRILPALLACLACVLVVGCGGTGGGQPGEDPAVYFINASADAGELDFLMNEIIRAAALDYLENSPDFTTVPFVSDANGGYDVVTQQTATSTVVDAQNGVLNHDSDNVFIGLGLVNFAPGENLKRFRTIIRDVNRTAPTGNKARLYIVHAFVREVGQATPAIRFQNAGDNPQFFTGGIEFGETTELLVDSGTMDWWAKRNDASADVIYAMATVTLDPASVYIVLVSGIENDPNPLLLPKLTFLKIPTD